MLVHRPQPPRWGRTWAYEFIAVTETGPRDSQHVARRYIVEDTRARGVPLLERRWYYVIEVERGVFTPGLELEPIHLTRSALRRIDVAQLECLDVGTMEALVPILLARRGAKRIVAYDRLDFSERIEFLKAKLDVDFEYVTGFPLAQLPARLSQGRPSAAADHAPASFDLVVFSGVIYHMLDPLGGLLGVRRLVRNGGIMIVETAAVVAREDHLYLNSRGRYFWGDNFWLPSLSCLDYMLRFAHPEPLDCFYLPLSSKTPEAICRVCVPCLAVDHAVAEGGDEWIKLPQQYDVGEHLSWDALGAAPRPPLSYGPPSPRLARRPDGSIDIYESVRSQPKATVTDKLEQICLRLHALY